MNAVVKLAPLVAEHAQTFVTVTGAAEIANKHPETVRDAARAGLLHGSQSLGDNGLPKKGARWNFRPECVTKWVEGEKCDHQAGGRPVSLASYRAGRGRK